jgi:hypothetical protein
VEATEQEKGIPRDGSSFKLSSKLVNAFAKRVSID